MKKVFVHLGYPKTGTTFLQKNLFPFHRDIKYLGNKSYDEKLIFPIDFKIFLFYYFKLKKGLLASNDQITQFNNEIYKFEKNIEKTKANLISNEGFLSPLSYFSRGFIDFFRFLNSKIKSEVKFFFIITSRNYDNLLFSFYCFNIDRIRKTYPKIKSFQSFVEFLEFSKFEKDPAINYFYNCFDYKQIIIDIKKNFGTESLLHLKYEEFLDNKIQYFEKISLFLDIDFTITKKLIKLKKFENHNNQKQLDTAFILNKFGLLIRSKMLLKIKKIFQNLLLIY